MTTKDAETEQSVALATPLSRRSSKHPPTCNSRSLTINSSRQTMHRASCVHLTVEYATVKISGLRSSPATFIYKDNQRLLNLHIVCDRQYNPSQNSQIFLNSWSLAPAFLEYDWLVIWYLREM